MAQSAQNGGHGAGPAAAGEGAAALARVPLVLLVLAVVIFAARVLGDFVPAFYALADEHGYLTTAKRLAIHGELALHQPDPYAFVGETLMQAPQSARGAGRHSPDPAEPDAAATYYLRQPIGYPLLCAAAYKMIGPVGPFLVNPLAGLALLAGAYVLGRKLNDPLAGALAALVLASHPVLTYYTIKPLSHLPDMAAGVWVMVAALWWKERGQPWQAAAVGLLLGAAILIRYTNVLLLLPAAVIWWNAMRARRGAGNRSARLLGQLVPGAAAMALILAPLAIYQARAFGSLWRTGYSAGGNATSFSLRYFLEHAPAMAQCLIQPGTGLTVLALAAVVGIVVLVKKDRWTLALLLAWALPPLILYTAYYGKPQTNLLLYARFGLASYVPVILLGLCWPARLRWGARGGGERTRRLLRDALPMLIAAAAMVWSASDAAMAEKLVDTRNTLLFAQAAGDLVKQNVPPNAVILADNQMQYYLEYATDCVIYSPGMFRKADLDQRLADLERTPHEFDPARTRQLAELLGGRDDAQLAESLRQRLAAYRHAGRQVYLLATKERAAAWEKQLMVRLKPVAENPLEMGLYGVEVESAK